MLYIWTNSVVVPNKKSDETLNTSEKFGRNQTCMLCIFMTCGVFAFQHCTSLVFILYHWQEKKEEEKETALFWVRNWSAAFSQEKSCLFSRMSNESCRLWSWWNLVDVDMVWGFSAQNEPPAHHPCTEWPDERELYLDKLWPGPRLDLHLHLEN